MAARSHVVKIVGREEVASGTLAFYLEKPPGFAFTAGQAVRMELLEPPADEGQRRRAFSLASAPFESTLAVATRMRGSAFKNALRDLPIGANVKLTGPMGRFVLSDATRPAVLIAGGIGITPFVSMLRQAVHDGSAQPLVLLYSNRRAEEAAYLDELGRLEGQCGNFRLCVRMTDASGFMDADFVRQSTAGLLAPRYYVVGPPGMVAAMRDILRLAEVAPTDLTTEEFYGY